MIGIVQGRLTDFKNKNILQKFPKNYSREFIKASGLGFDFIEIFTENKFNKKNPIWFEDGRKNYIKFSKQHNLKLVSLIDEFSISNNITKKRYLIYFSNLLKVLKKIKIKKLIIPLYKKSHVNEKNYLMFSKTLSKFADACLKHRIKILVEADISFNFFLKLKTHKNIYFLYDTGNRYKFKNPGLDISEFGKNIKHVHIKDKNLYGENVSLGSGVVKFNEIFKALKKISYAGDYVFETTRMNNSLRTAKKNISFLKRMLKKWKY